MAQGSFVEAEARQVDVVCVVLISSEMDMGWVHPWVGLGWVVNEK